MILVDANLLIYAFTLCSADEGFARFADLSWENPLKPPGKEETTSST